MSYPEPPRNDTANGVMMLVWLLLIAGAYLFSHLGPITSVGTGN